MMKIGIIKTVVFSADGFIDKEEYTDMLMGFGMSRGNCDTAFDTFSKVNLR